MTVALSDQHGRLLVELDCAPVLRAVINSALDAIVAMDADGRVLACNPAAEQLLGHEPDSMVGLDMAETMVPPDLRDAHRHGLRRLLGGADPVLLDRRVQVRALHRDGHELPVELILTRVETDDGPPMFVGYLRDIRDRLAADEALRASRARIVEASDAARRRVERDLHDGAQQRMMQCAILLRELEDELPEDLGGPRELLGDVICELREATQELRELARGIHPAVLSVGGLGPALRTAAARCPLPVGLDLESDERFSPVVEVTAYFILLEALTNVGRGVGASRIDVTVRRSGDELVLSAADDGDGGADMSRGTGLRGLTDRASAVGGRLLVESPVGMGTTVRAWLPL